MQHEAEARAALVAWDLAGARLQAIEIGLINVTFEVASPEGRWVLQRLNPIFRPEVHEDIDAVTRHLAAKGHETPRLVRTHAGEKWVETEGGVWRLLTFVEGVTMHRLERPEPAQEAGDLLGRFHLAVADLEHVFENRRLGVHDTKKHLAALEAALAQHVNHRLHGEVALLAAGVLEAVAALPPLPHTPDRVVHGDPKISNVIFTRDGRARCFVDLDTLARMPVYLELGDAFRSWCNPAGEDAGTATFSLELFEAAVRGYAHGASGLLSREEIGAIVPATQTIYLELAARFAADALNESYFGWDAARFTTRGDHNLLRARRQTEAAAAMAGVAHRAEAIVEAAFAG